MPPSSGRRKGAGAPADLSLLSDTQLVRHVRDALSHLYNPARLETHPLAHLAASYPGDRTEHRGRALKRLLLACVDDLRPDGDPDGDAGARRCHRVLALHYVERLAPCEVQRRIGVGDTSYYRAHQAGLAAVASMLRKRWAASRNGDGGDPHRATRRRRDERHGRAKTACSIPRHASGLRAKAPVFLSPWCSTTEWRRAS